MHEVEQSEELAELTAWWQEYQQHNELPKHDHSRKRNNRSAEKKPDADEFRQVLKSNILRSVVIKNVSS